MRFVQKLLLDGSKIDPYNNHNNYKIKNKNKMKEGRKEENRAFAHVRLSFSEFHFVHTLSYASEYSSFRKFMIIITKKKLAKSEKAYAY